MRWGRPQPPTQATEREYLKKHFNLGRPHLACVFIALRHLLARFGNVKKELAKSGRVNYVISDMYQAVIADKMSAVAGKTNTGF